jgi:hypothetical protein
MAEWPTKQDSMRGAARIAGLAQAFERERPGKKPFPPAAMMLADGRIESGPTLFLPENKSKGRFETPAFDEVEPVVMIRVPDGNEERIKVGRRRGEADQRDEGG